MAKIIFLIPTYEEITKDVAFVVRDLKEKYRKVINIDLPDKLVQDICKKDFEEIKEELITEIKKYHDLEKLNKFKKELESYWNPLNDLFFDSLKKITGFDLKYQEYTAQITKIIRGSYGTRNNIYTNSKEKVKLSGQVVAEEILHLHYWDIFRKTIKDIKMPWKINNEIWEISEVVPEFVLTDNFFKPFGWGKDLHRTYNFIEKWQKKLIPIWENKKDFADFVIKINKEIIV